MFCAGGEARKPLTLSFHPRHSLQPSSGSPVPPDYPVHEATLPPCLLLFLPAPSSQGSAPGPILPHIREVQSISSTSRTPTTVHMLTSPNTYILLMPLPRALTAPWTPPIWMVHWLPKPITSPWSSLGLLSSA